MFRSVSPARITRELGSWKASRILCKGASLGNDSAQISKNGYPQKLFQKRGAQLLNKRKFAIGARRGGGSLGQFPPEI